MYEQPKPRLRRRWYAALGATLATVAIQIVEAGLLDRILVNVLLRWVE